MSGDEDLLSRLGAVAREQEREDEANAAHVELLGEDVRRDIVAQALAGLGAVKVQPEAGAKVVSLAEKRRRRPWLAPVAALSVAAAAALLLMRGPAAEGLPDYVLTARGGVDALRGGEQAQGTIKLAPDSVLDVLLRPAHDVAGTVRVQAVVRAGDELKTVELQPEISASGAIRVRAARQQVFGDRTGPATLVLCACRPAYCEEGLLQAGHQGGARGDGYQLLELPVELTP